MYGLRRDHIGSLLKGYQASYDQGFDHCSHEKHGGSPAAPFFQKLLKVLLRKADFALFGMAVIQGSAGFGSRDCCGT